MSQENVELVRRWYAWIAGWFDANPHEDWERIDEAFRNYLDEQFEARLAPEYPEGEQVFRGREGVIQMLKMFRDAWAEFRFEPERFLDAGDRVVVFVRVVAKGGASGIPIELKTAHVGIVREGRLTSARFYLDRLEPSKPPGC